MERDERYEQAKTRVAEIRAFYQHLLIYLIMNAVFLAVNMLTSPRSLWFFWPLFGWGIGVAAHGISVFGLGGFFGREWEEKKIKQILEKGQGKGTIERR
jgi:cytochrome b561